MSDIITGICAWCQAELPEEERDHRENISHGCCPYHVAQLREEIKKRKEDQP